MLKSLSKSEVETARGGRKLMLLGELLCSYATATEERDQVLSRLCDARDELDAVEDDRVHLELELKNASTSLERMQQSCDELEAQKAAVEDEIAGLKKELQRRTIASTIRPKKLHDEKTDLREQMKDLKQYLRMRAQVDQSGATDADVQGVLSQNTGRNSRRKKR